MTDIPPDRRTSLAAQIIDHNEQVHTLNGWPTHPPQTPDEHSTTRNHALAAHYLSTTCIHSRHNDCRRFCKVCNAACRCQCHTDQPEPQPDNHRYSVTVTDQLGTGDTQTGLRIDEAIAHVRYRLYAGHFVTIYADIPPDDTPPDQPPTP
jgi:hypothetical protein